MAERMGLSRTISVCIRWRIEHLRAYMRACMRECVHGCVNVYMDACMCTWMRAYVRVFVRVFMRLCVRVFGMCVHGAYAHALKHMRIRTHGNKLNRMDSSFIRTRTQVYLLILQKGQGQ